MQTNLEHACRLESQSELRTTDLHEIGLWHCYKFHVDRISFINQDNVFSYSFRESSHYACILFCLNMCFYVIYKKTTVKCFSIEPFVLNTFNMLSFFFLRMLISCTCKRLIWMASKMPWWMS